MKNNNKSNQVATPTTSAIFGDYDRGPKNRLPSYTDRVLYRRHFTYRYPMHLLYYYDLREISLSDHKPVMAIVALGTPFEEEGGRRGVSDRGARRPRSTLRQDQDPGRRGGRGPQGGAVDPVDAQRRRIPAREDRDRPPGGGRTPGQIRTESVQPRGVGRAATATGAGGRCGGVYPAGRCATRHEPVPSERSGARSMPPFR